MTVKELLSNPKRWCKDAPYRDINGNPVTWDDITVYSYCPIGAIVLCYGSTIQSYDIFNKLRKTIQDNFPNFVSITMFNDNPDTTHEDVMKVLEIAGI